MVDLFSGIAAFIVGVTVAIGGLFTPVNNASISHVDSQFDQVIDRALAIGDNVTNSPHTVSNVNKSVASGSNLGINTDTAYDVFDDMKKNALDPEEADANLGSGGSRESDSSFIRNKLLPGGVYSYYFQDYVPNLLNATEREMQSAYLYCLNAVIKDDVYILDEKMPSLYDVDAPERYYGKIKSQPFTCVDSLGYVFYKDDYCAAVKKLFSGADCRTIDNVGRFASLSVDARLMEQYDQSVAPVTDEKRKELLSFCIDYQSKLLSVSKDEAADSCLNNLVEKFGDSRYCLLAFSVSPSAKCHSWLLDVKPRVLPKTFKEWQDEQIMPG